MKRTYSKGNVFLKAVAMCADCGKRKAFEMDGLWDVTLPGWVDRRPRGKLLCDRCASKQKKRAR
jgi:hypothetical protein